MRVRRATAWGLCAGLGIGSALYEIVLRVLAASDVAVWPREHVVRETVLVLIGVTAIAVALVRAEVVSEPGARLPAVAGTLMGAGWAWVLWGLVDQHALHLFEIAPASRHPALWDVVFHGVGALVGAIGWNLLDSQRAARAPMPRAGTDRAPSR